MVEDAQIVITWLTKGLVEGSIVSKTEKGALPLLENLDRNIELSHSIVAIKNQTHFWVKKRVWIFTTIDQGFWTELKLLRLRRNSNLNTLKENWKKRCNFTIRAVRKCCRRATNTANYLAWSRNSERKTKPPITMTKKGKGCRCWID